MQNRHSMAPMRRSVKVHMGEESEYLRVLECDLSAKEQEDLAKAHEHVLA